jgi:hypothetical protein
VSSSSAQPTEEELRAAYEAELKKITVGDVVLQTAVSLINLAGRRLGLAPDSQDERDLEQVRDAIDSVRALMPVLERRAPGDVGAIRDALSRLQMAYAREQAAQPEPGASGGGEPGARQPGPAPPPQGQKKPGSKGADEEGPDPGPAESSGRLWVPGR